MPTVEERLANLEGRVTEHAHTFTAMRDTLSLMRDAVGSLERRMDRFEERVDKRFDALDDKMTKGFAWMIGTLITAAVAVIAAMIARG